ncbi:CmcI family methyltransferase [Nocardia suismassiliense]|uniref:CmcI family methyltransferase n=1 Tax=Nocardia suismassiliense TaxID=2077092 RepID=UPI00131F001F|nr:CmcI family methyltransferase [Nocardia suismassiliense]
MPNYYENRLLRLVTGLRAGSKVDGIEIDAVQRELDAFLDVSASPRFVDPAERLRRPVDSMWSERVVDERAYRTMQGFREVPSWRGLPLIKTAYDFVIYPMLIDELKPRSIIELGSGSGASALWFADVADAHGMSPRIVSIDIVRPQIDDPRVDFIKADITRIGSALKDSVIKALPKPWLVIDDAHVNVPDVLDFFDDRLGTGDYLVIEDSNSPSNRRNVLDFLARSRNGYLLDRRYVDMFGENSTSALDGVLKRL